MKWTKESPKMPGWYWYRGRHWSIKEGSTPVVVEVLGRDWPLNTDCSGLRVQVPYMEFDDPIDQFVEDGPGEWAGPLVPPT